MTIRLKQATRAVALVGLMGAATWPACAQYSHGLSPGMTFKSPVAALADFNVHQLMQQSTKTKALLARLAQPGSTTPSAPSPVPASSDAPPAPQRLLSEADFRPVGPRRVAEAMNSGMADSEERLRTVAALRDQQASIEAMPGFRKNNLACAMTLLLGTSIQTLTGNAISDALSDALLHTVNDALATNAAMASLDRYRRTEAYDTMLIIAMLIGNLAHSGEQSHNAERTESAKELARAALTALGLASPG